MQETNRASLGLAAAMFVLFLFGFIEALNFPRSAGYFPLGVTGAGLLASGAFVVVGLTKSRKPQPVGVRVGAEEGSPVVEPDRTRASEPDAAPDPSAEMTWPSAIGWILWAGLYVALLWLLGMILATLIFLVVSLRWFGKPPWWGYVVAGGLVVLLWCVSAIFALEWPQGIFSIA